VVIHRQRQHITPVRRLATIVGKTLTEAAGSSKWPAASVVR
jgi:hypothetical protein